MALSCSESTGSAFLRLCLWLSVEAPPCNSRCFRACLSPAHQSEKKSAVAHKDSAILNISNNKRDRATRDEICPAFSGVLRESHTGSVPRTGRKPPRIAAIPPTASSAPRAPPPRQCHLRLEHRHLLLDGGDGVCNDSTEVDTAKLRVGTRLWPGRDNDAACHLDGKCSPVWPACRAVRRRGSAAVSRVCSFARKE